MDTDGNQFTKQNETKYHHSTLLEIAPSLCDFTIEWKKLKLKEMKQIALRANAPSSWQSIKTKIKMMECLREKAQEYSDFVDTVRQFSLDDYLAMGCDNIGGQQTLASRSRNKQDDSSIDQLFRKSIMKVLEASVHIIPSGSGIHIGGGIIVTCAHCVAHDDDIDDDDIDDDDIDDDNKDGDNESDIEKIGRIVELINARGQCFGSICIAACSNIDLALLKINSKDSSNNPMHQSIDIAPQGFDVDGLNIFALGNPCDIDLESRKYRKNGYFPFHVSQGKLIKKISKDAAKRYRLGRLVHNAWTYWGHSGCPLIAVRKETHSTDHAIFIVGLHNSWDDRNGNRHGVRLDDIRSFVLKNDT